MSLIHDYQTLIAATLQLVVAFFALRPVYRQLGLSRIQSAITRRTLLVDRMEAMERERKHSAEQVRAITDEFAAEIFRNDPDEIGEPDVDPHWAHESEKRVDYIIDRMSDRLASKADPQVIDEPRARMIDAAQELENCLCDLHQWISVDFTDPDYGFADPDAERARAGEANDEAKKTIGARISAVRTRGQELDAAFEAAIQDLRNRIRQVNERVLKDHRDGA